MVGVCTDSSSQLPPELAAELGVEVVPVRVRIDGRDHLEGVDLDADAFYETLAIGGDVDVSTAAPSVGHIASAHRRLVERGAAAIVSIHVGSSLSSTLNAVRMASADAGVPVHIVDASTTSFGLGSVVWDATERLLAGASIDAVVERAASLGQRVTSVWIQGALELTRRSGRVATADSPPDAVGEWPVLAMRGSDIEVRGSVRTVDDAVARMTAALGDAPCRVGVGHSDDSTVVIADRLAGAVARLEPVTKVVRYRVGPSVGAHTGLGTVGLVVAPTE